MADEMPADAPTTNVPALPGTPDARRSAPDVPTSDVAVPGGRTLQVTRSVDLDAGVDDVWRAVTDPAERSLWLDDPDAAARHLRVDESHPGERLVWTWWHPGDQGGASTVAVELRPVAGGGTRVVVTETLPASPPRAGGPLGGAASVRTGAGGSPGARGLAPAWVRCAGDRWDSRLLGLELLYVAPRVVVA
jgi:uncharacterized protein YndB with AHSA1/START domain